MSRVVTVTRTQEPFSRPPDFDLAGYWTESTAAYEQTAARMEVVLRVHPAQLERLGGSLGPDNVGAAERLDRADPEGWLHLRIRLDWPHEVPERLLAVGSSIEVLEPAELRVRMADTAREVLRRYAS